MKLTILELSIDVCYNARNRRKKRIWTRRTASATCVKRRPASYFLYQSLRGQTSWRSPAGPRTDLAPCSRRPEIAIGESLHATHAPTTTFVSGIASLSTAGHRANSEIARARAGLLLESLTSDHQSDRRTVTRRRRSLCDVRILLLKNAKSTSGDPDQVFGAG